MKNLAKYLLLFSCLLMVKSATAQSSFTGAQADRANYKALYYLDSGDNAVILRTLRNINNALDDPRIHGKVQIELVAFGDGVAAFQKNSTYGNALMRMVERGVILAQCKVTLTDRSIDPATLFPFIGFVPSGNGEIIIRATQGWAIIHP